MIALEFQREKAFQVTALWEAMRSEAELEGLGWRCWGIKQDNKSCFHLK